MANLGAICVKGRMKVSLNNFKEDLHLELVDENHCDAVEADLIIERRAGIIKKWFADCTMVIEFSEEGYKYRIQTAAKKLMI